LVDWIGLLDPIYDLETPSHDAWIARLAAACAPYLSEQNRGTGTIFRIEREGLQVLSASNVDQRLAEQSVTLNVADPGIILKTFQGKPFNSMSGNVGAKRLARAFSQLGDGAEAFTDRDAVGLLARDGGAWGVCICTSVPTVRSISAAEAAPWAQVAAHIHAALRLRFRVHGAPSLPAVKQGMGVQVGIDAVVSPSGKIEHAEPAAQAYLAALKEAAVSIDRARARLRREDPEAALQGWRSLVEGRWSLVESFESDGRRYLLARRNAPSAPVVPLLTEREQQVLSLAVRRHSAKVIAYELGIAPSAVSGALKSGLTKLRVKSVHDVSAVLFPDDDRGFNPSDPAAGPLDA
jgi:DNA-binding NarL/FixJ family response regulator